MKRVFRVFEEIVYGKDLVDFADNCIAVYLCFRINVIVKTMFNFRRELLLFFFFIFLASPRSKLVSSRSRAPVAVRSLFEGQLRPVRGFHAISLPPLCPAPINSLFISSVVETRPVQKFLFSLITYSRIPVAQTRNAFSSMLIKRGLGINAAFHRCAPGIFPPGNQSETVARMEVDVIALMDDVIEGTPVNSWTLDLDAVISRSLREDFRLID